MAAFKKLGLIAGGGALPVRIVAEREAAGEPYHLIRIAGAADENLALKPGDECGLGEVGKVLKSLRSAGCDAVCFAGLVRRPDFSSLKVDLRGAALLPKIIAAAARGDGAILDVLVATLESEGFQVVGADDAVQSLLAPAGAFGAHHPDADDLKDITKAATLIDAIGPFDVGQGAVVALGHVLAIEAAEGTDLMLARCAAAPVASEKPRGVLVKRPKPGQELRVDMPVIGAETVRGAARAKLKGIAVEAEHALLMEREETIAAADKAGVFLYGFSSDEIKAP